MCDMPDYQAWQKEIAKGFPAGKTQATLT
jgi:hypothetical protein